MLPVEQVIAFIHSEDPLIFDLAGAYLKDLPPQKRPSGELLLEIARSQPRSPLAGMLPHFAITPPVLECAIETASRSLVASKVWWPWRVLEEAPQEFWTPEVAERVRDLKIHDGWLRKRVERNWMLRETPDEELRRMLLECCAVADERGYAQSQQGKAAAVVPELSRREGSRDWARQRLSELVGRNGWEENWVFDLLQRMRDPLALEVALDRFLIVDDERNESLRSSYASAIGHLGDAAHVDRVRDLLRQSTEWRRASLIEYLGHSRIEAFEPLLVQAGIGSDDIWHRTMAMARLCEMLADSAPALQFISDVIDGELYDPGYCDPAELALPLGMMIGKPFAQSDQWRKRLARKRRGSPIAPDVMSMLRQFSDDPDDDSRRVGEIDEIAPFIADTPQLPDAQPVAPRSKVGRNEPCPCGSGKKYKKCCMNAATPASPLQPD